MDCEWPKSRNQENRDLLRTGWLDEVSGTGGCELEGFKVTVRELDELFHFWLKRAVEIRWALFEQGRISEEDRVRLTFAERRVRRIARILLHDTGSWNDEIAGGSVLYVYREVSKDKDPNRWAAFLDAESQVTDEESGARSWAILDWYWPFFNPNAKLGQMAAQRQVTNGRA